MVQTEGQTEGKKNPKSAHSPKSTLQDKMGYSREQLAKIHFELKAKERSSLVGLEKALMESDSETEGEVGLGQKKEMVKVEMFEAFMVEQTFLVEKPAETDHSKEAIGTEVLECSIEDAS